jgi:hypothetical protein
MLAVEDNMTLHNAPELRTLAGRYREMSRDGDDLLLKAALIQLADEFEQEAASLEEEAAKETGALRL